MSAIRWVVLGCAAGVGGAACGPDWDALDPALRAGVAGGGGMKDTDAGAAGDGGAAAAVGAGGPGSTGGASGSGGAGGAGGSECAAAADCPGEDGDCAVRACVGGVCRIDFTAAGSSCARGGGARCDGAGACIECQPATTTLLSSSDTPVALVDGDPAGVSSVVIAAGLGGAVIDADVHVVLAGQQNAGDVTMVLVAPSGTSVELTSENGGSTAEVFAGSTFDDDAAPPALRITEASFTGGVAVAAAIPERNLGHLLGEPADGPWTLVVADASANGDLGSLSSWSLTLTTQPGNPMLPAATLTAAGSIAIPDGASAGVAATLPVEGVPGRIGRATVTTFIKHHASGQLSFELTSPAGTVVALSRNNGGGAKDVFDGTTFDDEGPVLMGCQGVGCATYQNNQILPLAIPEGSLSALTGEDPNGIWSLTVVDGQAGTSGTLKSWSIEIVPALCPMAVP